MEAFVYKIRRNNGDKSNDSRHRPDVMLPLELKAIQMAGQGVRKGRPDYACPLGIQQAKNDQDDPWDQNFHVNAMQTVASPETALYREHDSKEQKSLKTNCEGVACAFPIGRRPL